MAMWHRVVFSLLVFALPVSVFAGAQRELPQVSVAVVNLDRGLARLAIDWKGIRANDPRQFGLYKSSGAKAASYNLLTTLNTGIYSYTDAEINIDTEYHYIIADYSPKKALPASINRTAQAKNYEKLHPEAVISYGNIPAGPIEWNVLWNNSDGAYDNEKPRTAGTGVIVTKNGLQWEPQNSSGYQSGVQELFPYHEAVPAGSGSPQIEPVFRNGGVIFSMGFFSNRAYELSESLDKASVAALIDPAARSKLYRLLDMSYRQSSEPGTALYYAVHRALTKIGEWDKNGALSNFDEILLVTVTDGLDTASTDPAFSSVNGFSFRNPAAYQDFLKKTIQEKRFGGKKINAVSIGIRGNDTIYEKEYQAALGAISSSPQNIYRITPRSLSKILASLASKIINRTVINPYTFITPAYPDGTEIFIALDGNSSPASPNNFIGGRIRVNGNKFVLEKILRGGTAEYSPAPSEITGIRQNSGWGVEWNFEFFSNIKPGKMALFYRDGKNWRSSKEFIVQAHAPIYNKRSSFVYLLIDNSSSMSERNIDTIREAACIFIDSLKGGAAPVNYHDTAALAMRPVAVRKQDEAAALNVPPRSQEPAWPAPSTAAITTTGLSSGNERFVPSADVIPGGELIYGENNFKPLIDVSPGWTSSSENTAKVVTTVTIEQIPAAESVTPSAKSAAPQPESVTPPNVKSGYGDYWVQTSAHENPNTAEEMAELLRKYNFEPVIIEAPIRGKTFYRVRIGPYASTADAKRVIDFVKEPPLGFFDSFIP